MIDLINAFINSWVTLRQMNIYLEIPLAGFAVYWWVYDVVGNMSRKVELIPISVCFLGQMAYSLKHAQDVKLPLGLDDAFMILFMTIFQAGVSHMAYRWAYVKKWIGQDKRKDKDDDRPAPAV